MGTRIVTATTPGPPGQCRSALAHRAQPSGPHHADPTTSASGMSSSQLKPCNQEIYSQPASAKQGDSASGWRRGQYCGAVRQIENP